MPRPSTQDTGATKMKTTNSAIEFVTDLFEISHGKKPKGRGSWAFCPWEHARANDYLDHTVFSPSMTYGDAKKWAKSQKWADEVVLLAVMS
jgi:hypothetical protein